ncbi:MmcQ/YjbR family DNA-binding protein [Streptomyces sp. NPDC050743]|uniref:MmcQ/YjbR family DNA-binding protein n=1 Tax=Streptomyces sp. NPDC050743 TaxID=3365634 RepID=UPI0037AE494F
MPIIGEKLQDRARDTALALARVSQGRPFTWQLDVYKVAGKVLLIVMDDPHERSVTLTAEPEYGRLLQHEHPSITPGLPTKPSLPSTTRCAWSAVLLGRASMPNWPQEAAAV